MNKNKRYYQESTIRTVEIEILFGCCYDGIYYPEPIPLKMRDIVETSLFRQIKSLVVWKDMFLSSSIVVNYITDLCNDKCKTAIGGQAEMCDDGYEINVLDYYEE